MSVSDGTGIQVWNRQTQQLEREQVLGEKWLSRAYGSRLGRFVSNYILAKPWVSRCAGIYNDTPYSARKISEFIREYRIKMEEYEPNLAWRSFNEFFIRKFRTGARTFCSLPSEMPAFCEARYFGFESVAELSQKDVRVKGVRLRAEKLLGDVGLGGSFENGPLLIARLCPTDYHRFHFPDDGTLEKSFPVRGPYHSVNPVALIAMPGILAENERYVSVLQTRNFGKLAYVEVGAMCVGRIVQTYSQTSPDGTMGPPSFKRGDEKGYFLFGASTVIVLGEQGRWVPSADILEQTRRAHETFVRLGEPVAQARPLF
ncbi:phosphatidylserine decarboxylase [Bdellovibrionota bacterium FG-2]